MRNEGGFLCKIEECTGCNACLQICKHDAISSVAINGFNYPVINSQKCKHCGLCESVCPIIKSDRLKGYKHDNENRCLAVWNRNLPVRMNSSSGGAFSALATKILSDGGVVFGAAWNEKLILSQTGVQSLEKLDTLRGSKYVQSDTKDSFNETKAFLLKGRIVMYCGTPCQIAGLKSFLGDICTDNLVTIDILCQGVPSQWSFSKYIEEVEQSEKCRVLDCVFRSKERGWRCGLLSLKLLVEKNGKQKWLRRFGDNNEYYYAFINELFMRESCYNCKFKNDANGYYSDITLADFWRIGNEIPFTINDYHNGVSALIINTEKGRELISSCRDTMNIEERTWKEFSTNGGLWCSKKKAFNDEALQYLTNHSWRETQKVFFPIPIRKKIKYVVFLLLGERVIRMLFKRGVTL